MGCGTSKGNQIVPLSLTSDTVANNCDSNSSVSKQKENTLVDEHGLNCDDNENNIKSHDSDVCNHPTSLEEETNNIHGYPKPVAFAVNLSENDSIVQRRFQRLEPLEKNKVTVESLEQKQKQAQNRKDNFIRKKSKKASRLQDEIHAAREQNDKDIYNEVERKISMHQSINLMRKKREPEDDNDSGSYTDTNDDMMEVDDTYNVDQENEDIWQGSSAYQLINEEHEAVF